MFDKLEYQIRKNKIKFSSGGEQNEQTKCCKGHACK